MPKRVIRPPATTVVAPLLHLQVLAEIAGVAIHEEENVAWIKLRFAPEQGKFS